MSSDESFNEVQEKLMTLNLLRITFEKFRTLDHLRQYFLKHDVEVSLANFSRYINGKAIPKSKLKNQLLRVLLEEDGVKLKELIINGIESWSDESGIVKVNNTQLLNDLKKLQAILFLAIQNQIIPKQVDKIISLEGNSVHVASVLAHLLNVNYVNAREKKPIGTKESYVEDISKPSIGILNTIYLPKDFIKEDERIILVDDIIRTGTSMKALLNLVRKSGGNPVQIIILTGIGSQWESVKEFDSIPFKSLTVLP